MMTGILIQEGGASGPWRHASPSFLAKGDSLVFLPVKVNVANGRWHDSTTAPDFSKRSIHSASPMDRQRVSKQPAFERIPFL
jgi:hypothetical protein